jgi:hypothetical protein
MDIRSAIDIVENHFGTFTADQAREIGSCAIISMSHITGKSWEEVWEVARPEFGRYGMNSGGIARTLRALGWENKGYFKLLDMTVRQAEAYLQQNDPDAVICCQISVQRIPHSIAFVGGKFHNVQGAYKAKIRLAYQYTKVGS